MRCLPKIRLLLKRYIRVKAIININNNPLEMEDYRSKALTLPLCIRMECQVSILLLGSPSKCQWLNPRPCIIISINLIIIMVLTLNSLLNRWTLSEPWVTTSTSTIHSKICTSKLSFQTPMWRKDSVSNQVPLCLLRRKKATRVLVHMGLISMEASGSEEGFLCSLLLKKKAQILKRVKTKRKMKSRKWDKCFRNRV